MIPCALFLGWNKNWDEWVPESRILKINPENLDKKEKLLHNHQANIKEKKKSAKNAKPGGSGSGSNTPLGGSGGGLGGPLGLGLSGPGSVGSRSNNTSRASTPVSDRASKSGGKRALADDERSTSSWEDETPLTSGTRRSAAAAAKKARGVAGNDAVEEAWSNRKVHIELPEELKYVLVSDWDLVTHKRQIFQLPAKIPVSAITAEFLRHVEKGGQNQTGVYSEVVLGLREVFDDMLGLCLLYKSERKQFESLMKSEKSPFELYGSPHLLRFMVKLGPYLKLTNICIESDMRTIEGVLKEFLAFLESNRPKYFSSKNYVDPA